MHSTIIYWAVQLFISSNQLVYLIRFTCENLPTVHVQMIQINISKLYQYKILFYTIVICISWKRITIFHCIMIMVIDSAMFKMYMYGICVRVFCVRIGSYRNWESQKQKWIMSWTFYCQEIILYVVIKCNFR